MTPSSDTWRAHGSLPGIVEELLPTISELCRKHHVQNLYIFGSATRGDFTADSDLDWVVEFRPDAERGGFDDIYFRLLNDLEDTFSRRIDLVEWAAVSNPYFKKAVESERRLVYAA